MCYLLPLETTILSYHLVLVLSTTFFVDSLMLPARPDSLLPPSEHILIYQLYPASSTPFSLSFTSTLLRLSFPYSSSVFPSLRSLFTSLLPRFPLPRSLHLPLPLPYLNISKESLLSKTKPITFDMCFLVSVIGFIV